MDDARSTTRPSESTAHGGRGKAPTHVCWVFPKGGGNAAGIHVSPEQIQNAADVDHRTDVWALGVVLYELLTGRKPFTSTSPVELFHQITNRVSDPLDELRPGVALELVAVVERALKKDRDQRLPTVTKLAEALAPFTGRPSAAPVAGAPSGVATGPSFESRPGAGGAPTSRAGVSALSKIAPSDSPSTSGGTWAVAGVGAVLVMMGLAVAGATGIGGDRDFEPDANASAQAARASTLPTMEASVRPSSSADSDILAPVVSPVATDASDAAPAPPASVRRLSEHFEQDSDAAKPPRLALPACHRGVREGPRRHPRGLQTR